MAEIRESIVLEVKAEGAQQTSQQLTLSFDRLVQSLENIERNLAGSTQSLRELAEAERRTGQAVQKTTQEVEKQGDAIDKTNRSTERAGRTLSQFSQRFQATASAAQSAVGPLTRIATIFAGGLGVRAVSESLASFERGLTQVQAISRATVPELERIRQTALDLGATTSKSASEALQGAVELARAGFSAVEVPEALPATLNLAVTAQLDLGRASEIAANSIRTFGLQAGDTVRVTDALTVVANNASTDVQQLADALSFAGPLAASFGLDIEQTAAALGAISDGGIKASRAGTGLAGILRRLVDPSKEAREEFDRINVAIESLDPRTNDFADVVDRLGEAYRNGADFTKVFEAEQLAAAITLARLEERFDSLLVKQRESVDAAGAQADAFGQDLRGSIDRFRSTVEALVLKTGDQGLTGALRSVTEFGIETISVLGDLDSSGRKASDGANLAASAIEGAAVALGGLIALAGGASFIAALANPFVAAAAAVGALVTATRLASRELEDLREGSVAVAASIEEATRSSEEFRRQLADLDAESAGLRVPRTIEDSERLIVTLINGAIQLREQNKRLAADPSTRIVIASFDDLNRKIEDAKDRSNELRQQIRELESFGAGPSGAEFGGPLAGIDETEIARLTGLLRDSEKEVQRLTVSARVLAGVTFVPVSADLQLIASQAGLSNELAEAQTRAAQGSIEFNDAQQILEEASKRLGVTLEDLNGKSAENKRVAEEAAAAVREQAAAEAELNQQKEQRAFEASTQAIKDQIQNILNRTQAIREAGVAGGAFLDVIRQQRIEDAALTIQEQELARLQRQGIELTEDRVAATLIESTALAENSFALQDVIKSKNEEYQAQEKLNRQADRKETSLEQREAKIAAQRAAQAQEQAAGIARALQLEAQSYGRTREEVERLRLEEQLRGLEVSNNLKDEIRLIQQQTEEIRKSREAAALVGSSLAGGVGDALRTLRDSGSGADALIAGLQGVSDRIFEASIAQIEQALTSVFTDAFAVPTAGESLIVAAVNRVEAAVLQSTTIGAGVGAGAPAVAGAAGGVAGGVPTPAGGAAAPQGGPIVAGAQADGAMNPPIASATAGDFYGPPIPQQSFWQGFQANFGPALATTAASFAFSAILSRFAQRDREEERAPGFRVLGLGERFAGTGYNDNRRVTNYISPTQRSQQQTFRQEAEQRTRRF